MDSEHSNSTAQLERDELNEQLDEIRLSQQESVNKESSGKTSGEKKRSRWGCLIGTLVAIGGLFLFWRAACRPQVISCYSPPPDIDHARPMCYKMSVPPDDMVDPDDNDPATDSSAIFDPKPERESVVEDTDAGLEEIQQYYEKVKRESPVNNVDNAQTNDKPTE